MRALDLKSLVHVTQSQVLSTVAEQFSGVGTDTRQDLTGQLFIALKGEAFDAHQFVDKAVEKGAVAILVHEKNEQVQRLIGKVTVVLVQDTLKALQQLGTWARRQAKGQVVAITGSNGKTTTKEFAAALISTSRSVHFNKGSFNNHWGVPFTLLQLDPQKQVAVVEMGMNHAGEITELVHIAEPDVVVCTMVGRAHVEFFGSIEKIAEAKEEIYNAASEKALRIYNLDNPQTQAMHQKAIGKYSSEKILTFSSLNPRADVFFEIARMSMKEIEIKGHIQGITGSAKVEVFGAQNLTNLMAAATLALSIGMTAQEIWQGLSACKTNWGRNQLVHLKSGAQMIFDAYNANPDSMKALIENVSLLQVNGKKVGVFGQMREMGTASPSLHEELGLRVAQAGFDKVYFVGEDQESFKKVC